MGSAPSQAKDARKTVETYVSLHDLEGPVSEISATLLRIAEEHDINEPRLEVRNSWGDDVDTYIIGWCPLTPAEIRRREVQRQKAKERAAVAKERAAKAELAHLERLAKKHGVTLAPRASERSEGR